MIFIRVLGMHKLLQHNMICDACRFKKLVQVIFNVVCILITAKNR